MTEQQIPVGGLIVKGIPGDNVHPYAVGLFCGDCTVPHSRLGAGVTSHAELTLTALNAAAQVHQVLIHPQVPAGADEGARAHVAWLLWCLGEGYANPADRACLTNWLADDPATLHPDDARLRPHLLGMADEVLAVAAPLILEAAMAQDAMPDDGGTDFLVMARETGARAERERIRRLAIERDAMAWDGRSPDVSGMVPFADLLGDDANTIGGDPS